MCPPALRARLRRQCFWMVCSARSSLDTSSSLAHRNAMYLQQAPVCESRCYMTHSMNHSRIFGLCVRQPSPCAIRANFRILQSW